MKNQLSKLFLILACTAFHIGKAQWSKYPVMNTSVCQESSDQQAPAMTTDGAGGTIITWYDQRNTKDYDIYAQRLNAWGVEQWTKGGVLICSASGDQAKPVITSDGNGGAIIAWMDRRGGTYFDLYAQRIDASGSAQWTTDGIVVDNSGGDKINPCILPDNSGGAIIVWEDTRSGESDVYGQYINSGGKMLWNSGGLDICTIVGNQRTPRMIKNGDTVIVVWDDSRTSKKAPVYDIYAQGVDLSGNLLWTSGGNAICTAMSDQTTPVIAPDDSGGAIISWQDLRGAALDIFAQRVDKAGNTKWVTDGVSVCGATGAQMNPEMVEDGAHGAMITWKDSRTSGASHIYIQRINAAGTSLWTTNGVALCVSAGSREKPLIIKDGLGGAIVVWSDTRNTKDYDMYVQAVNSAGLIQWTSNGSLISSATNDQTGFAIVSDNYAGAFVAWTDSRGSDKDIYSQNIQMEGGKGIVSEITVKGNGNVILDNDNSPSTADYTDFGSVTSPSPIDKTYNVYNTGNDTLKITNISVSGANAADFALQSLSFPIFVDAHSSTSVKVTYTPNPAGASNASLNIDNNDSNEAAYNFGIRGTYKTPEVDIKGNNVSIADGDNTPSTSDSTDYGKTRLGKSVTRSFTLYSTGTDSLKITSIAVGGPDATNYTIAPIVLPRKLSGGGKTMTFYVTFTPTTLGTKNAVITISSNDLNEGTYDFAIQGTSIQPSVLVKGNNRVIADGDVTPDANDLTDFGKLPLLSQKTRTFKVFNTGTDVLEVKNIYASGLHSTDYSVQSMTFPLYLDPEDSVSFDVTLNANTLTGFDATINVETDDDNKAIYDFAVNGISISPELVVKGNSVVIANADLTPSLDDHTDFGPVARNGSMMRTFTIENSGSDNLSLDNFSVSGTDASLFTLGSLTPVSPILPGSSATFTVTFKPLTNGQKTATVNFTSNDMDEGSFSFGIQGLSTSPAMQVKGRNMVIADGSSAATSADGTDFGSVEVPNTVERTFVVVNNGNDKLNISGITSTGADAALFEVQNMSLPKDIAPGDSLVFTVTFKPVGEGTYNAVIKIGSSDADHSEYDFALSGAATEKHTGLFKTRLQNIGLFPNPVSNLLYVSMPSDMEATIKIVAVDGKVVVNQVVNNMQNTIDVSHLEIGIYVLQINSSGNTETRKIVVRR